MGIGLGTMALTGTGLAVGGQLLAGKDKQEAAEWNAAMARYDAAQTKTKARIDEASLRREGEVNELLRRRDESLEIGSFRAQAGASGLATDSQTNQAVVKDIMKRYDLESEIERRNIEWDASIIRYQGDVGAASSMTESKMYKEAGKQARTASYIGAASTMLTDVADMKSKGVFARK